TLDKLNVPSIVLRHGVTLSDELIEMMATGQYRGIFVTPEFIFMNERFKILWRKDSFQARLMAVFLDEAHCVLQWAQSFRPFYSRLAELRFLTSAPLMCASATLSPAEVKELINKLRLKDDTVVINEGNNRPNVYLE
ncbi:ATP-dependent DNA helicase sgs1, partial [Actinomortierella ambigua]